VLRHHRRILWNFGSVRRGLWRRGSLRGWPGCPSDCDVEFIVSEALHLSLDEKSGDLWREAGQLAVRRKRNPLYLSMMIADESHVPKEAPKILPAGKFADVDHQPLQITMRFDPVIGAERQRVEILRAQGLLDLDHDHARVGKDTMRNSGAFRKRA